jgi:hypothetical protein
MTFYFFSIPVSFEPEEKIMTLFGLLWSAFAPLTLVLFFFIIFLLTKRTKLTKKFRILIAFASTLIPLLALWLPARIEFSRTCQAQGAPTVAKTALADGFYLDDSTASSFGMRYLQDEGFSWIEAKSIYDPTKFTRYEKNGKAIVSKEINELSARYALINHFEEHEFHKDSQFTIIDRQTGEKLAWAHSFIFDGDPARWLLGGWGVASCPDDPNEFLKMYHLAKLTLIK